MADSEGEPIFINLRLTPDEAFSFLEMLARDDDLRARLETDTLKVLAEHGIDVSPELIPSEVRLPPKEELERALPDIKSGEFVEQLRPFRPFAPFAPFWIFYVAARVGRGGQ